MLCVNGKNWVFDVSCILDDFASHFLGVFFTNQELTPQYESLKGPSNDIFTLI